MADDAGNKPPPPATGDGPPQDRRKFFAQALRETLTPLTGLIEDKINPVLEALEEIPRKAEELSQQNFLGALDQPQVNLPPMREDVRLPVFPGVPDRILRPPGAVHDFLDKCEQCGKCVEVCPAQCIKIDHSGAIAGGKPYIAASETACVLCDDLSCMKNCPTGALALVDKFAINMGKAKVSHETCLRNHGEECRLCVDACPLGERAIVISGATGRVAVKYNGCIGCGLCENHCPTEPRAIVVVPATLDGRDEAIIA